MAAISRAVAWVHLGEPATIRGAYRSILPRLGRYLWLMTITAFMVWTPFALLYGGYFGVHCILWRFQGHGRRRRRCPPVGMLRQPGRRPSVLVAGFGDLLPADDSGLASTPS